MLDSVIKGQILLVIVLPRYQRRNFSTTLCNHNQDHYRTFVLLLQDEKSIFPRRPVESKPFLYNRSHLFIYHPFSCSFPLNWTQSSRKKEQFHLMEESLEMQIGSLLRQKNLKLAVAESCTGGLICDRITNIPGSSEYFMGGIVAYAYQTKVNLLGVSWETLNANGAVSRPVVLEMARGARRVLATDLAVSVSGIAGPGGALDEKPVGTTWIGLSTPHGDWTRNFRWNGNRQENKAFSAEAALQMVLDYLEGRKNLDFDLK